jgi:aryl-alcohol dehydrogenase-like predicted oxidoreductase
MGASGPELSLLGFGSTNFGARLDQAGATAVVQAALDMGVTHFDTAELYGDGASEEILGKALGSRRDEAFIASKFMPRAQGSAQSMADRVREGCETSLRRLGTDRIDLYYQHMPEVDFSIEETLEALDELVKAGKVMHVGCSNYNGELVDEAAKVSDASGVPPFALCELRWNLVERENEADTIPAVRRAGMGIVAYYPIASGVLTGKYRKDEPYPDGSRMAVAGDYFQYLLTDEILDRVAASTKFARERGHTPLELAFGWLAAQEGVCSMIAGATSPEQVQENARAATAWTLTAEDLDAVQNL